jgi:hypothetical protein
VVTYTFQRSPDVDIYQHVLEKLHTHQAATHQRFDDLMSPTGFFRSRIDQLRSEFQVQQTDLVNSIQSQIDQLRHEIQDSTKLKIDQLLAEFYATHQESSNRLIRSRTDKSFTELNHKIDLITNRVRMQEGSNTQALNQLADQISQCMKRDITGELLMKLEDQSGTILDLTRRIQQVRNDAIIRIDMIERQFNHKEAGRDTTVPGCSPIGEIISGAIINTITITWWIVSTTLRVVFADPLMTGVILLIGELLRMLWSVITRGHRQRPRSASWFRDEN